MLSFYIALAALWAVLIGAGYLVLGKDIFRLLKLIRGPMLVGFSTASSESVYPKLMEQLEKFGIKQPRHRLRAAAGLLVQPRRLDDVHHLRSRCSSPRPTTSR